MSILEGEVLQVIIQVAVTVIVPVLGALIAAYVGKLIQDIKLKMDAEQLAFVGDLVARFVAAAEQYALSGKLSELGKDKKVWVVERVQEFLDQKGILVDFGVIADLIEAEVIKQFGK